MKGFNESLEKVYTSSDVGLSRLGTIETVIVGIEEHEGLLNFTLKGFIHIFHNL